MRLEGAAIWMELGIIGMGVLVVVLGCGGTLAGSRYGRWNAESLGIRGSPGGIGVERLRQEDEWGVITG